MLEEGSELRTDQWRDQDRSRDRTGWRDQSRGGETRKQEHLRMFCASVRSQNQNKLSIVRAMSVMSTSTLEFVLNDELTFQTYTASA